MKRKNLEAKESSKKKNFTRPNRGRTELRQVSRRKTNDTIKSSPNEELDDEVSVEGIESKGVILSDSDGFSKEKAYNALLTLLQTDENQPQPQRDTSRKENGKETKVIGGSDEHMSTMGVNLDEYKNGSDSEEEILEEVEDRKQENHDPFEIHFNSVGEQLLEGASRSASDGLDWTISDKYTCDFGYAYSYQTNEYTLGDFDKTRSSNIEAYKIKKRLVEPFKNTYGELSELDQILMDTMLNYRDLMYCYKDFNNTSYRKLYALHALNHIYKTRDRILKNNEKLHHFHELEKQGKVSASEEPEFRDQGFTRPKVLILLPTCNSCYEVVDHLISISGCDQQENKNRFKSSFLDKRTPPETKPDDFRDSFRGNSNDFFCVGIKITRKSFKLYTSFYSSDIIVASPIGLSMILENPDKAKRQYDFLSSIEVVIVDRANQIEMQNWDHLLTIYKYLNKIPKSFHEADFSRIRMAYINDQSRFLTQNLVFCEYTTPNTNNIINRRSMNLGGKVKLRPLYDSKNCVMNSIGMGIQQIFQRFECDDPISNSEARFKFFINTILPSLAKSTSYDDGLLIFIPSYYDYLRVKSYMKKSTKYTFGSIDEYCSQSKLSKNRSAFASGKIKILLYTERLHYFRRLDISGVKSIIMYGLPANPLFYKELVRFIGKSIFKNDADINLSLVKIIFSRWDALFLGRIVGDARAALLSTDKNEIFEFR